MTYETKSGSVDILWNLQIFYVTIKDSVHDARNSQKVLLKKLRNSMKPAELKKVLNANRETIFNSLNLKSFRRNKQKFQRFVKNLFFKSEYEKAIHFVHYVTAK